MKDKSDIPLLVDLIEKGAEIKLSELGLDEVFASDDKTSESGISPAKVNITPALEQEIRRILDEHMELAWQEIRIAIQQATTDNKSGSES